MGKWFEQVGVDRMGRPTYLMSEWMRLACERADAHWNAVTGKDMHPEGKHEREMANGLVLPKSRKAPMADPLRSYRVTTPKQSFGKR